LVSDHSPVVIRGRNEASGGLSGVGIGAFGSPEEQDVRFWFVDFVVLPATGLLDAECSPFLFSEEFAFMWYFLHDFFGEDNVAVFVVVIAVFLGVLNFGRVVWHLNTLYYVWNSELV
jgi:hypothetical protein